jgi:hypothetical protein
MRRMVYMPGSPLVFNIERIAQDKGLMAPYSLIRAGERIFWLAAQGFQGMLPTGAPEPIGKEKFDPHVFRRPRQRELAADHRRRRSRAVQSLLGL